MATDKVVCNVIISNINLINNIQNKHDCLRPLVVSSGIAVTINSGNCIVIYGH